MTRVVCPFSCSTGTDPVHKPHSRVYESRWLALSSYPTNHTGGEQNNWGTFLGLFCR